MPFVTLKIVLAARSDVSCFVSVSMCCCLVLTKRSSRGEFDVVRILFEHLKRLLRLTLLTPMFSSGVRMIARKVLVRLLCTHLCFCFVFSLQDIKS